MSKFLTSLRTVEGGADSKKFLGSWWDDEELTISHPKRHDFEGVRSRNWSKLLCPKFLSKLYPRSLKISD